jgi:hypothetical protein
MPELHEESSSGAAAEIYYIDMADDDLSDSEYEQDPEGSDDCDSSDSDDVEVVEEDHNPNSSQLLLALGFNATSVPGPGRTGQWGHGLRQVE